ncbi:unnamed protein product [Orchesella dallaii]|uniref:Synaptonemal complex protein 1 n=1 Tax=Orchesella dallaii TaxID=48710 RepID=A0ABP1PPG6_9HEXA
MEAALSNVQDCLESTLTELKETKELMQLKMYSFAEEKESLRQTHEETVNDLTKRLEELNMSMTEKVSCFGEEKSKLISDHLDAISKVQTDLQLKSEELQVEKQEYEKIKAILVDVQAKYESTSSELTSTKELMNKTIVSFENEKAVLTSNNKQTVDDVTKQLTDLRILLEENSASFTKEKSALVTQHDEAIATVRLDLEVCKEELQIEKTSRSEVQNALNELQGQYDSTMKQLADIKEEMAAKVSSHTKERELLISDHKEAMESLEQEYKQCKAELQAMHNRLVEQKKAISKLVDETNSRPIILPSSKDPKKGVRQPISASQDRLEVPPMVYKPLNRSTPSTPGRPRISAPVVLGVESPKSRGILKRPSDSTIGDKSKNVSFGPTYVTDFHISSSSDTETSSGEVYRPTKDPNVGKRMRLTKSKKDKDVNEEFEVPEEYEKPVQQGKETKEKQQRRFFRNNVTIPKGSAVNSQSAS